MKTWKQISEKYIKTFHLVWEPTHKAWYCPVPQQISEEERLSFIHSTLDEYVRELIGSMEDDGGWTPDNQTMEYEEAVAMEERNQLRQELLKKHEENMSND